MPVLTHQFRRLVIATSHVCSIAQLVPLLAGALFIAAPGVAQESPPTSTPAPKPSTTPSAGAVQPAAPVAQPGAPVETVTVTAVKQSNRIDRQVFGMALNATGKQLFGEGYRKPTRSADLNYRRKLTSALNFVLNVNDVFDSQQMETVTDTDRLREQSIRRFGGRTVSAGLSYRFGSFSGPGARGPGGPGGPGRPGSGGGGSGPRPPSS